MVGGVGILTDMQRYLTMVVRLLLLLLVFVPDFAHADPQYPIVIRFRYWGDVKEIAIIQDTINAFEHDHPGVTVRREHVGSNGDEYGQKLLAEQAAGLTPDVIFCGGGYAEFANHGVLQDLTPFVNSDPTLRLSDYYQSDVKSFQENGKIYAIPRDIAPMGLVYYNKSLFDQAHLPYPDGTWSWDYVPHPERGNKDFLTVAEKLSKLTTADGQEVFGYEGGDPSWTMDNFVYSSGGSFVDNIFSPTKLNYNDPKIVKAIQLEQDMMFKYNVMPSAIDLQSSGLGTVGGHQLFDNGRLAMYVSGIWEVPAFRAEINHKFGWDIAAFPAGPTGLRGVQTGWSGYGMSASCKHKQEAWELIKYLAGPKGMTNLAKSGLAQPAIASLANSSAWLDNNDPKNRVLTCQEVPYVHYDVIWPDWTQITNIVNPKLQLVWNNQLTAQQAINQFLPPAQAKLDLLNHPAYHPPLNWGLGSLGLLAIALLLVAWVWQGARKDTAEGRVVGGRAEARAGYLFLSPWLVGGTVFLLVPMLVSLLLAFSAWNMIEPAQWVGMDNVKEMLKDEQFWKSLQVTGIYTLFSVPLGIVGSLSLALLLNAKIRGQNTFRTLFYLPSVASAVAAALIWLRVYDPESGLINNIIKHVWPLNWLVHVLRLTDPTKGIVNWLGDERTALGSLIVMSLWGIGGGMIIFLAGLQGIPQSYYEAADLDGANVWQKFKHVTLPLLTPTIFFNLVIGVISALQAFTQAFVMTAGGPNNATLFYVLYLYQNAFQFLKMGYASALAWVLFIIILACTLVQLRLSRWVYYEGAEAK